MHFGLPSGCVSLQATSKCLSHSPTGDEVDTEQDGKKRKSEGILDMAMALFLVK